MSEPETPTISAVHKFWLMFEVVRLGRPLTPEEIEEVLKK